MRADGARACIIARTIEVNRPRNVLASTLRRGAREPGPVSEWRQKVRRRGRQIELARGLLANALAHAVSWTTMRAWSGTPAHRRSRKSGDEHNDLPDRHGDAERLRRNRVGLLCAPAFTQAHIRRNADWRRGRPHDEQTAGGESKSIKLAEKAPASWSQDEKRAVEPGKSVGVTSVDENGERFVSDVSPRYRSGLADGSESQALGRNIELKTNANLATSMRSDRPLPQAGVPRWRTVDFHSGDRGDCRL